jgi:dihydrolipoamide dehydrogenase
MQDFDLLVIGSGPGGYVAAIRGAQHGLKVGLVEKDSLGGVCVNWGCIPTKALLRSAEALEEMRRAAEYGLGCDNPRADFKAVIKRSREVAKAMSRGVSQLMRSNKVRVIKGAARLLDAKTVSVLDSRGAESKFKANHIIIATGASPRSLPRLEFDGKQVLSSSQAMNLASPPKSLAIIGAGPIGVEFAHFYHALGCEVTLIEMLPHILPQEDHQIAKALSRSLEKRGIRVMAHTTVDSATAGKDGVKLTLRKKGASQSLNAEACLVAIGVRANIEGLGLSQAGVELKQGFIKVDRYMRTSLSGVRAIGDVAGPPMLAHIASREALVAIDHLAGLETPAMSYDNYPSCTYCSPQVASVGLTERQALDKGLEIKISRVPFKANGKAKALGAGEGMIKLITGVKYGKLIGVHILGPQATELIAEYSLARSLEATHQEIAHCIHAHPTLSEVNLEAALAALGKAIHL